MAYYTDKTTDNIQQELLDNVDNSYEKTIGYPMYDTLKSFAIALADVYKELSDTRDNMENVDNLSGADLERFVEQRTGIQRKLGTYATTNLTVNGNGTVHMGDKFETKSGIEYACTIDTIINGTGLVPIQALQIGTYGNTPANTIIQIPVTLNGIVSITNLNVVSNGIDNENDDFLRERYYTYLRNPITSNNENAFINWAESIDGVGRAKAFGCWQGKNSVLVVICNSNMQVADQTLIDNAQNIIDPKGIQDSDGNWSTWGMGKGLAGAGSYTTIQSAVAKNINISATIVLATNYTKDIVQSNFELSVTSYLKTIALKEDTPSVSYAKIGNLLYETEGINDYSNLQVNGGNSNVPLSLVASLCEIPETGTVTLNV
ncbi:baseplate J/gp47 family protein [Clostridium autoethanogenum]|uniref:Baseplate J/gp47 family protein n=1 Tax=Clostridium autoethanogenum DSM 10061 TaxID=1341692 RepID=A0ABN4BPP5_9CLOT|nr:baseplate J/gp47 family protein [Clostridium autoethanogenum]AGY77996.1 baseplate J/gp47 family protein [Clostridium autoethanogenum DSM 10061]ALU38130.1 Baseplate J family protein [Clostridium autoethanogenum DSM 10061]OVY50894.1 Baseplate J-like protein [Clostridium autoethanogenum]